MLRLEVSSWVQPRLHAYDLNMKAQISPINYSVNRRIHTDNKSRILNNSRFTSDVEYFVSDWYRKPSNSINRPIKLNLNQYRRQLSSRSNLNRAYTVYSELCQQSEVFVCQFQSSVRKRLNIYTVMKILTTRTDGYLRS